LPRTPSDRSGPGGPRLRPRSLRAPASAAPARPEFGADRRRIAVGLMGGSFNPAHAGHRHVAELAFRALGVAEVWWLVSPQNPLKSAAEMAPLRERIESARRAARHPRIRVRDLESRLGTRYTADTLLALRRRCPRVRFVWIMGADNLAGFHRWKGWVEIFRSVPIAVVARPGALLESRTAPAAARFAGFRVPSRKAVLLPGAPAPAWTWLRAPLHPQSSTALRARARVTAGP